MTAGVKTKLDFAEVLPDATLQIRLKKVFDNGAGVETLLGTHRTVITPLTDGAAQLDAVDGHLAAEGATALPASDRATILDLAAALHTEERRAAYAAQLAAADPIPVAP